MTERPYARARRRARAGHEPGLPWHALARDAAQRIGLDPRDFRRVRWFHKARAVRRSGASVWRNLRFVLLAPETDNFTYEIANEDELAEWAAAVAGCESGTARAYVSEPRADVLLTRRRRAATARRWLWSERLPPFGKRLGWYALVRALRPALIIEVGIHDGLGALLLLRALERNADDGYPGRLVSFDVNPDAGWLVGDHGLWEPRFESSQSGLPALLEAAGGVDMFIYDGWHSYEPEHADLVLAADYLNRGGVLLSDDAQHTRALSDLSRQRHLDYSEFQEVPKQHFYPGSVLGAGRRASGPTP